MRVRRIHTIVTTSLSVVCCEFLLYLTFYASTHTRVKYLDLDARVHVCVIMWADIYMYIYIEREREQESHLHIITIYCLVFAANATRFADGMGQEYLCICYSEFHDHVFAFLPFPVASS